MLLNLSNHPSNLWTQNQLQAAKEKYGNVNDLPFPHLDPEMNSDSLDELVKDYYKKVISSKCVAVHLMGELTFCFRLANKLKAAGFLIVASTTTRTVSYDATGNKISTFGFVQFREY